MSEKSKTPENSPSAIEENALRFVDLFCGIGGFHIGVTAAAESLGKNARCVWSCDIDKWVRQAYQENFGLTPAGDITEIDEHDIPDHDLLCAGFPCQPFSVFGKMRGFADTHGTLFFDIARVLKAKQPPLFILENVKQLASHRGGQTLSVILKTLAELGYQTSHKVCDARDFGLPQKRERVIIVGRHKGRGEFDFTWPGKVKDMAPLSEVLESSVSAKYTASDHIRQSRINRTNGKSAPAGHDGEPMIYHENKSGNVSIYPFACALRAGSSYNYLLVDGKRRLTERELLRLQGFPEWYKVTSSYTQVRRQTGNAVPAPMIQAVAERLLEGTHMFR